MQIKWETEPGFQFYQQESPEQRVKPKPTDPTTAGGTCNCVFIKIAITDKKWRLDIQTKF